MTFLDYLDDAGAALDALANANRQDDLSEALKQVRICNDALSACAARLVERGIRKGMSQASIARCLDVPASTLRGAKREFAR